MLYSEFTVGDHIYKLRLESRNIVGLEDKIGRAALLIFGEDYERVPTVKEMVLVLFYSLQKYNHGISLNDAYDIFDKWLAEGNAITDFTSVIVDIYVASGLMHKVNEEEEEKN